MHFIEGVGRDQEVSFVLDEVVAEDYYVRLLELLSEQFYQKNKELFVVKGLNPVGRKSYPPSMLLGLLLYGYFNSLNSSRRLEQDCQRNLELRWLCRCLAPDHKTIANFRKDHAEVIPLFTKSFNSMLKQQGYMQGHTLSLDGSKLRASASKSYSVKSITSKVESLQQKSASYFKALHERDEEEDGVEHQSYYIYGAGGLLATYQNGQWLYMIKDHLGSTRVILDEQGNQVHSYDYTVFGEVINEAGGAQVAYQYTGQEKNKETNLHNYRARLFDSDLGRFYSVDPQGQYHSPFVAMGNNPANNIDPDGEFVFSALIPGVGTFIDAALRGGVIGGVGYSASVGLSPGGFDNWDGGQFKRSVAMGATSGVLTAGVGTAFGPVGSNGFTGEIGRAVAHGTSQTLVDLAFCQEPSVRSYLTSFASSLAGSTFMMYGGKFANSKVGLYGFSMAIGGATSKVAGGSFLSGATMGLINAKLNHARANVDASGAIYFSNKKAFYNHLWKYSFDKAGNPVREVSGWELDNGHAIALPYDKNYIKKMGQL